MATNQATASRATPGSSSRDGSFRVSTGRTLAFSNREFIPADPRFTI